MVVRFGVWLLIGGVDLVLKIRGVVEVNKGDLVTIDGFEEERGFKR